MAINRCDLYKNLLKDVSGVGVEVGTCWGGFAEFLAVNTPLTQLYCVDPYKVYPKDVYNDALNTMTQEQCDDKYKRVQHHLSTKPYLTSACKISMLRCESEGASFMFEDNSLDFVYIDANHHFSEVLKDLCFWWPKLKSGGILAGDDVEVEKPHTNGNLFVQHAPGSYGLYGVRTAIAHFKKLVPTFDYKIVGHQFYAYK